MLVKDLPAFVQEAVLNRNSGYTPNCQITPEAAFDEWCSWEGFIDYGPSFRFTLAAIQTAAEVADTNA